MTRDYGQVSRAKDRFLLVLKQIVVVGYGRSTSFPGLVFLMASMRAKGNGGPLYEVANCIPYSTTSG